MAELSYGGERLPFPNDASMDMIDEFLALNEAVAEASHYDRRTDPKTPDSHDVGLAVPNWPAAPKPEINRLYWPTGATRWAVGYFLATTDILEALGKKTSKGAKALEFVAKNREDQEFTADLWMLKPRPVTAVKDSKRKLFILPLVDERYFWRFKKFTDESANPGLTWAQLFSEIGDALGVSITPPTAPPNAWLWPDHLEVTRRCEDPTQLLDAAAASVGGVVVRQPGGKVEVQQWAQSIDRYKENTEKASKWKRIAGGKLEPAPVAGSVNCVFRWIRMGATCDEVYTITNEPDDAGVDTEGLLLADELEATYHVAAYAEAKGAINGSPANANALQVVAKSITAAHYEQRKHGHDETFAGIKEWTLSAHDDGLLYSFGAPAAIDAGEINREWATRVRSHAQDFGPTEFLNQERIAFHGLRWGVAITPPLSPDPDVTGHACWYVVVNPCDDCNGGGRNTAIQHEVILPGRVGFGAGLPIGSVISYEKSEPDCRWVISSDYSTGPHRLKALLTDYLNPGQPLALFDPLTVISLDNGDNVFATTGWKLQNAWNTQGHAGTRGYTVWLEWDQSLNFGLGGYYVGGVTKRPQQVVIDVKDGEDCLGQAKLMAAMEFANHPSNYCPIVLYDDCDDTTPPPQSCTESYIHPDPLDECFDCCEGEKVDGWAMRIFAGAFGGGAGGCCANIQATLLAFGAGHFDPNGLPLTVKVDQCTWISPFWFNGCGDAPFAITFRLEPSIDPFADPGEQQKVFARLTMAGGQLEWTNNDFQCTDGLLDLTTNNTGCGSVPTSIDVRPLGAGP